MLLNLKNLTYFASGMVIIATPVALVKSSHYVSRLESFNDKNNAQSWAGAAAYYNSLKADPLTGVIDESVRSSADQEAELRMKNSGNTYKTSALGLNWSELGPDDVGGRVRSIVYDKKNRFHSFLN